MVGRAGAAGMRQRGAAPRLAGCSSWMLTAAPHTQPTPVRGMCTGWQGRPARSQPLPLPRLAPSLLLAATRAPFGWSCETRGQACCGC